MIFRYLLAALSLIMPAIATASPVPNVTALPIVPKAPVISPLPIVPKYIPTPPKTRRYPSIRVVLPAKVIQIIDGDTIRVLLKDTIVKVRFGCIDAPELRQPLGKESAIMLATLLLNKEVQVSTTGKLDLYGRIIGSVYADKLPVSPMLVRNGLALFNSNYAKSCSDLAEIKDAESLAKSDKLGYWGLTNPVAPWDFRRIPATQPWLHATMNL